MRAVYLAFPLLLFLAACDSDEGGEEVPNDEGFPGDAPLLGMWEEVEDSGSPDYVLFQPNRALSALRIRVWEDRDASCYELDEDYTASYTQISGTQIPGPRGDGPIAYALNEESLTLTGLSGGGPESYRPSALTPPDIQPLCP